MRTFAIAALFATAPAWAAHAQRAFGPGETSTYAVTYLGMQAGEAQIMVGSPSEENGPHVWPIVCMAKTTSIATSFRIKDKFVSWWDDKNGRTLGNDLWADEFHKRRHETIRFMNPEGKAQVTRRLEGQPVRESEWDVEPGVLDVAAAMMSLRNAPLALDKVIQYPVFTGTRNVVMKARVLGKEKLNTALGPKEVWKLAVQTEFSGKLAGKKDVILYLAADRTQVPVKIDAEFVLGTVTIDLVKYEQGKTVEASG